MQLKEEEKIMSPLDNLICQPTPESHSATIHTFVPKGRLSLGFSNHQSRSGRKIINLKSDTKQELPVLGHKVVHN